MNNLKQLIAQEIPRAIETMTSLKIVNLINMERSLKPKMAVLRHSDFITKSIDVLGDEGQRNFSSTYTDKSNRTSKCLALPRRETMLMLMSYSYELQAAVYDRMEELENKTRLNLPTTFAEALLLAGRLEQEKEQALLERNQAIETKAWIGERREATAMNTASQAVKRANKLEKELDQSKQWSTVKRMEILTGLKFKWRLLKSAGQDLQIEPINVPDQNYGTVKAYHADVWLEAYALDINQ